ncbi:MAG: methylmalonyl Co-A mutase-associated GTPase MeaB [Acidimicrobiales bacterium]|nr:methylmalonyl Co-A mutase-associated GTPase MeaB [Acidimicrobiales bacterium]
MPESMTISEQLEAARTGDRLTLARLLSHVERGDEASRELGSVVFPLAKDGYTIGLTGAPGAGKSTLTSALVGEFRSRSQRVAVLAVDPSSPFTGGALLGDRTRMNDHALDKDVFIRSMATRGHLGGLALATPEAIRLLDAVGFAWVIVETVGVGQVEVEIAGAADTTVVVINPGWGDSVQANKAGLMEIADVFVVNKADREGAKQSARELETMLDLTRGSRSWRPPVVLSVATTGEGSAELCDAVLAHRDHLTVSGELTQRRAQRVDEELSLVLTQRLRALVSDHLGSSAVEQIRTDLAERRIDPWAAADQLLGGLGSIS